MFPRPCLISPLNYPAHRFLPSQYADPVTDLLDQCGVFRTRLFRESCVFHQGCYVKDLSRLGRDLHKTLILDNSPASYIFHPHNAVSASLSSSQPVSSLSLLSSHIIHISLLTCAPCRFLCCRGLTTWKMASCSTFSQCLRNWVALRTCTPGWTSFVDSRVLDRRSQHPPPLSSLSSHPCAFCATKNTLICASFYWKFQQFYTLFLIWFFIRKSIFQWFFYATQYCNCSSGDVAVANISVALFGVSRDNTFEIFFHSRF